MPNVFCLHFERFPWVNPTEEGENLANSNPHTSVPWVIRFQFNTKCYYLILIQKYLWITQLPPEIITVTFDAYLCQKVVIWHEAMVAQRSAALNVNWSQHVRAPPLRPALLLQRNMAGYLQVVIVVRWLTSVGLASVRCWKAQTGCKAQRCCECLFCFHSWFQNVCRHQFLMLWADFK